MGTFFWGFYLCIFLLGYVFFRYRARSTPSCAETLPRRRAPLPHTEGVRRAPPQFHCSLNRQWSLSTRAGALLRVPDSDCARRGHDRSTR